MALPAWLEAMAAPVPGSQPHVARAAGGSASQDAAAGARRATAEASVLQLASRAAFLLVQQPDAVEGSLKEPLLRTGTRKLQKFDPGAPIAIFTMSIDMFFSSLSARHAMTVCSDVPSREVENI